MKTSDPITAMMYGRHCPMGVILVNTHSTCPLSSNAYGSCQHATIQVEMFIATPSRARPRRPPARDPLPPLWVIYVPNQLSYRP